MHTEENLYSKTRSPSPITVRPETKDVRSHDTQKGARQVMIWLSVEYLTDLTATAKKVGSQIQRR